jgi:hypothetical protein
MINKTERAIAQRELLAHVGQKGSILGFAPKPSGQTFYQSVPEGKWAFHVSFIPHESDFDLTVDLAVRINKIEDLVNAYDSKLDAAEKSKNMTLGGELGNLSEGRPRRWTISSREDIPSVSGELVEAVRVIGMPCLEEWSNLAVAHRLLTSSDPKDLQLAPILGPRYMRAVATAHLLGDVDRLNVLVKRYEARLLEADDLYLEDFRSLHRGLGVRPT